jgi:hypothetical protein
MAQRVASGAFGSCSGTESLPSPTTTDDLLPSTTLGSDVARSRAVRPDDGVVGEDVAPKVVAGDVRPLPRAAPGTRCPRAAASRDGAVLRPRFRFGADLAVRRYTAL